MIASPSIAVVPERLRARIVVDEPTGCWLWLGCRNDSGYGRVSFDGGQWLVHRLIFTLLVGPITAPTLDHVESLGCRHKHCCNPTHLEPCSIGENLRRSPTTLNGRNVRRTHCKHGHEFDEKNTGYRRNGERDCRACARDRMRRHRVGA